MPIKFEVDSLRESGVNSQWEWEIQKIYNLKRSKNFYN